MPKRVFICYRGDKVALARQLWKALNRWQLEVFYDQDIGRGDWWLRIQREIARADVYVILCAKTFRFFQEREVVTIYSHPARKQVIPVLLPQVSEETIREKYPEMLNHQYVRLTRAQFTSKELAEVYQAITDQPPPRKKAAKKPPVRWTDRTKAFLKRMWRRLKKSFS
jgi:TIR domain